MFTAKCDADDDRSVIRRWLRGKPTRHHSVIISATFGTRTISSMQPANCRLLHLMTRLVLSTHSRAPPHQANNKEICICSCPRGQEDPDSAISCFSRIRYGAYSVCTPRSSGFGHLLTCRCTERTHNVVTSVCAVRVRRLGLSSMAMAGAVMAAVCLPPPLSMIHLNSWLCTTNLRSASLASGGVMVL